MKPIKHKIMTKKASYNYKIIIERGPIKRIKKKWINQMVLNVPTKKYLRLKW